MYQTSFYESPEKLFYYLDRSRTVISACNVALLVNETEESRVVNSDAYESTSFIPQKKKYTSLYVS